MNPRETLAEILAFDPARSTNASLIADCDRLGYLRDPVVDVTYGQGRFWRDVDPPAPEHRFDLDPSHGVNVADFRDLPLPDGYAGTVVLDPPYKLNGTSSGRGPAALDDGYGVGGTYRRPADLHAMILDGIDEAARVTRTGGYLLVKCQAQQVSGRLCDQPGLFSAHATNSGFWHLDDHLHVVTTPRKQPRAQKSARSNYSTLIVLQRKAVGR